MSKIEAHGSRHSSDWNDAWNVVSQLAAARGTTLSELGEDDRNAAIASSIVLKPGAAIMSAPFVPIAPDQLARDIAEIERAAAALRRAEPALEARAPDPQAGGEARPSRSIWPLVCVIWLTALAVVACAVGTIVLLLG